MKIGIIIYDLSTLAGGKNLSFTLGKELQKAGHEIAYACVYEDLNKLINNFGGKCNFKIYKPKKIILGKKLVSYNTLFNHISYLFFCSLLILLELFHRSF